MKNLMWKLRHRKSKLRKYFERKKIMSGVNIITKHAPWVTYRTVTASDTILTSTTKKGVNVPSYSYKIPAAMNNVELRIAAVASAGMSADMYFYGARWLDKSKGTFDDISLIGSASITSGDQLSSLNYYYVDTIVLTDRWITETKVADGNGNNGMSRIAFDASGYDVFFVLLDYTDVTNWLLDISGW